MDFRDLRSLDGDFRRFGSAADVADCETYAAALEKSSAALRQQALQAELDDVRDIHAAGVHLLAGTDVPYPCTVPIASLWRELALLVRAGLTPYEALKTATVEPAAYFGRITSGILKPGNIADIVLTDEDPFENVEAIRSVSAVIKEGHTVDVKPGKETSISEVR